MRYILHSDLNNFYASVEVSRNPALLGCAVVVVGDEEKRHGIVLAKNYLAKSLGVKTGDTVWQAKLKCCSVRLAVVTADFQKYLEVSQVVKKIYAKYSDKVESFGIDESWIDISKNVHSFSEAYDMAEMLRQEVYDTVGITVSVGVSWNKIFAKLGSDLKKPNAVTLISTDNYKRVVWPLAVEELLYVGRATKTKLNKKNICTIGDLANTDLKLLKNMFGKVGEMLWNFANGLDDSDVREIGDFADVKSVGNSVTCPIDLTDLSQIKSVILTLSESVAMRMRKKNLKCNVIHLFVKDNQLMCWEKQMSLPYPTMLASVIFKFALEMFEKTYDFKQPIRALGIRANSWVQGGQTCMFFEPIKETKLERVESTIENIREKYGNFSIIRGRVLGNEELSDINPYADAHIIHPVFYDVKNKVIDLKGQ